MNGIGKLSCIECVGNTAGKTSPANIPSRGLTPLELLVNKLWGNGPEWLQARIDVSSLPVEIPEPCIEEMKIFNQWGVHSLLTTKDLNHRHYRLYGVITYFLKFISLLRKQVHSPELTTQDITEAER